MKRPRGPPLASAPPEPTKRPLPTLQPLHPDEAEENTRSYGPTEGDHGQVSGLEAPLDAALELDRGSMFRRHVGRLDFEVGLFGVASVEMVRWLAIHGRQSLQRTEERRGEIYLS